MVHEDGRRRQALGEELAVAGLQVLGLEPVQAVVAQVRHEVERDVRAVALVGPGSQPGHRDRLQPVGEPLLERRGPTVRQHDARVPDLLEGPHFSGNVRTAHASDVTAVALPVALEAHRHVAVPAAVRSLVNAALAVRRPLHHPGRPSSGGRRRPRAARHRVGGPRRDRPDLRDRLACSWGIDMPAPYAPGPVVTARAPSAATRQGLSTKARRSRQRRAATGRICG